MTIDDDTDDVAYSMKSIGLLLTARGCQDVKIIITATTVYAVGWL